MPEESEHTAPSREPDDPAVGSGERAAVPFVVTAVETLGAALEELTRLEPRDLPSAHLLALVRDLDDAARRLSAVQARVLAAVETDGLWAARGARSFAAWVRSETGASAPRAGAVTRTARALRDHLPLTATALATGRITAEHAQILARHATATPARIAALGNPEVGEQFLVDAATGMDATDFSRVVRAWSVAADPESADRDYASDLDREELVLARALRGWHLQGWLEDADGAALAAALDAYTGTPAAEDTRTTAQRRAAALVALARMALDTGALQPGASIRPHLTVHVGHQTLSALADAQIPDAGSPAPEPSQALADASDDLTGPPDRDPAGDVTIPGELDHTRLAGHAPAELDDGTPIPGALLARLACDSELARVIFGSASEVLDVGRAQRLFPPAQRRAVIARDRCCQYPGCDAPPSQGEIHHSIWWYAQHGSTRAADGVLLCWWHHAYVHANAITIVRGAMPDPDRPHWRFYRRNGGEVIASSPSSNRRALRDTA